MAAKPELPKLLTNAGWQKEKGLLGKIQGETGIGAELTKLEGLYKAVDWNKLVMGEMFASPEKAEQWWQAAKEEGTKHFPAMMEQCRQIKTKAELTAKMFDEKNSKTAGAAARKVGAAADGFILTLKSHGDVMLKDVTVAKEKAVVFMTGVFRNSFTGAREMVNRMKKDMSLAKFTTTEWNKFRTMGTMVPGCSWANEQLKSRSKVLMAISPDKLKQEQFPQHVHNMESLLNDLDHAMPH